MIKHYLKPYSNRLIEVKQINTETGEVLQYFINNDPELTTIKYPFAFYHSTVEEMGYKSPAEMILSLKKRKQLGDEVDHDEQTANEINSLFELAKARIEKCYHVFDIEEKLIKHYGFTEEEAVKALEDIKKNIA